MLIIETGFGSRAPLTGVVDFGMILPLQSSSRTADSL